MNRREDEGRIGKDRRRKMEVNEGRGRDEDRKRVRKKGWRGKDRGEQRMKSRRGETTEGKKEERNEGRIEKD